MSDDIKFERADAEKAFIAEKYVSYVRTAIICLNALVYYFLLDKTGTIFWLANVIVGVSLVYTLGVIAFEPSRRFPVLLTSYFTSITDAALITFWILATGGVNSPYYVLWYASIVAIAFRYNLRETVLAAGLYAIGYIVLLAALGELATNPPEILLRIAYIFFVGVMGGLLSREAARQVQSKIQMRDMAQMLDLKVMERTRELVASEARAHEANRLKSEFLATMSHELRTPLNAMIGFTEIMLAGMGGELDQDAHHMTERIHANSKRLLGLINDVLDISKIEAKRVEVNARPFSPRQMAADLKSQMASLAQKKSLAFETEIDPELPETVVGDKALIERVATNLLANAFKFTEHGKVTLSLKASGEHRWSISVQDTGMGIPPHAVDFIFDPFRQLDGSSQRAYGGSGLGLAIVRELVQSMSGSVRVESVVGRGSTFIVTLPLVPMTPEISKEA